jgi:hypothetical protein
MEQLNEKQENAETETTPKSRKFNLKFGYQDKENPEIFHREVVISRRPTGADLFRAVEDGTDGKAAQTRINLALIKSAISKFGELPMSVPITTLFSLNEIDEDKLNGEYLLFLIASQPEIEQKILENERAQLAFGIERDGVKYHVVEFGKLLNGYDRIAIQADAQNEWMFQAKKIAREVVKLSTLDGSNSVSGELTFEEIEAMDATDFLVMREAEGAWLNSFRD